MRYSLPRLLLATLLAVSAAACSDDPITAPTPGPPVTDTFTGTLTTNGAVSYGLRRPVVSWDSVRPEDLDLVIAWLREQGFHPLIVVDQHEEEQFRRRFSSSGATGALDWPPSAIVHRLVRVFDPAERARFVAGGVVSPTYVDPPRR